MAKKSQMDTDKHKLDKTTEHAENTEVGFEDLVRLFEQTHISMQSHATRAVNSALVVRNWLYGWYISEYEKQSKDRSVIYGKRLMEKLSKNLTAKLGKGFSRRTLDQFRQFYEEYPKIRQTVFAESLETLSTDQKIWQTLSAKSLTQQSPALAAQLPLNWSHYLFLMGISNPDERKFYEIEAANESWSLRELKRQFSASLYERLSLSKDKEGVKKLSEQGQLVEKHADVIKDPLVLEFLGFEEHHRYSETELETAIIDKLEHFLLELGKGFLFEARQKRFTFDEDHFFVDLVFYNRLLRCYVIIDLKIGELKHQDLGQMQMYVNYFDRYVKLEDEQSTIGIVLCKKKKDSLVEITLPEGTNIRAAKYQTYLPDKEALKKQLEEAQIEWEATHLDSSVVDKENK